MTELTLAKGLAGKLKHYNSTNMRNTNLFKDEKNLFEQFMTLKKSGDKKVALITSRKFRDDYTSSKAVEKNIKRIAQTASRDYQKALNIRFNMIMKKFPKPPKVPALSNNNLRKLPSNLNTIMRNSESQNFTKYQVPDNFNEEAIMAELNEINNQIIAENAAAAAVNTINKKPIKRDMFLFIKELYEQTHNHKYWKALDPYYQYPYLFREIFETINKNTALPKTNTITPEKLRTNTITLIRRLINSTQPRDNEFLKTYITWKSSNGGTPNGVKRELQTVLNELELATVAEPAQAERVAVLARGGNRKKVTVKKVGIYRSKGGYYYRRYKNGKVKRISKEIYKKCK